MSHHGDLILSITHGMSLPYHATCVYSIQIKLMEELEVGLPLFNGK